MRSAVQFFRKRRGLFLVYPVILITSLAMVLRILALHNEKIQNYVGTKGSALGFSLFGLFILIGILLGLRACAICSKTEVIKYDSVFDNDSGKENIETIFLHKTLDKKLSAFRNIVDVRDRIVHSPFICSVDEDSPAKLRKRNKRLSTRLERNKKPFLIIALIVFTATLGMVGFFILSYYWGLEAKHISVFIGQNICLMLSAISISILAITLAFWLRNLAISKKYVSAQLGKETDLWFIVPCNPYFIGKKQYDENKSAETDINNERNFWNRYKNRESSSNGYAAHSRDDLVSNNKKLEILYKFLDTLHELKNKNFELSENQKAIVLDVINKLSSDFGQDGNGTMDILRGFADEEFNLDEYIERVEEEVHDEFYFWQDLGQFNYKHYLKTTGLIKPYSKFIAFGRMLTLGLLDPITPERYRD